MPQPLTQQQIAEIKAKASEFYSDGTPYWPGHDTILSLIATLEARDAAFEEMLESLKKIDREVSNFLDLEGLWQVDQISEAEYTSAMGDMQEQMLDNRSAIAHAEKVR